MDIRSDIYRFRKIQGCWTASTDAACSYPLVLHRRRVPQGSRSTPKLRRNQPSFKYHQGNASVDSFTSLRPYSPGIHDVPSLPNSPVSVGSIPAWHELDVDVARSPVKRLSFPAGLQETIEGNRGSSEMVKRGLVREKDKPLPTPYPAEDGSSSALRRDSSTSSIATRDTLPPLDKIQNESTHANDAFDRSDAVVTVRALRLESHEVAVITSKHETGKVQIFDHRANDISYIYGSLEELARVYEKGPPAPKRGTWSRFASWSARMKDRLSGRRLRLYKVEVWHVRQQTRKELSHWAGKYRF